MTLNTQTPRVVITGNGTRGPYNFTDSSSQAIRAVSTSHIRLTRYAASTDDNNDGSLLVENTDYTVSGSQDARTFTLTSAQAVLTSSQRIVAERVQGYNQDLSLTTGGAFTAASVMSRFDKIAEFQQELKTQLARAPKLQFADATADVAFPSPPTSGTVALGRNTSGGIVHLTAADFTADVLLGTGQAEALAESISWSDIASATTTELDSITNQNLRVTGTTTITSFGTATDGLRKTLRFAASLTLTYNSTSLVLPGAKNLITYPNLVLEAVSLGSGNWIVSAPADQVVVASSSDGSANDYAMLNAAVNSGATRIRAIGKFGLSTGLVIPADVVLDATGATFLPLADINVIRLHGGAQLIGDPLIDCSSQVGWNSAAVLFSGASESSSSTYFRLNKATVARVRCKCTTTGSSHGTAISFQTVDNLSDNQWIMGVDVEATVQGFDKALHMVKDGTDLVRTFITSNYIKIDGESALQTIVMESDHASGWSLDGNQITIRMQSRAQNDQLAVPVVLCGAQNLWEILQWDWLGGPGGTTKVCTIQSGAQLNTLKTWMDPALVTNSSTSRTNIITNLWTEQGLVFGEMRSIATDTVIRMHGSYLRADSQKGLEFENAAGNNEWISFTTDSGDNAIVQGNSAAGDGIYLNANNSTGFAGIQINSVLAWLIDSNKHIYYPGFAGNSNAITMRNFNTAAYSQDFCDGAGVMGLKVSVPASASAAGKVGMWAADSSYAYFCTATNTWVRGTVATW